MNCPNCGEKVPAANINVQKMMAVCAACDTVFSFDTPNVEPEKKIKRRKVKQPAKLTLRDDDRLHMEFWTNFRLDRNEVFILSAFGSIGTTLLALGILSLGRVPTMIPLAFLGVAVVFIYAMALIALNKTHIDMDEDVIRVTRKPLPTLNQGAFVSLTDVEAIRCEETAVSKEEAYDTPRFRVWAETTEGNRRTIMDDITEEYAIYITQRLSQRLNEYADLDVSRLEDGSNSLDDDLDMQEGVKLSAYPASH